ncbi:hypothetical protein RUK54_001567 [Vibrio cholerae]|nr:hypothetical protein [Vibrio cholerae]
MNTLFSKSEVSAMRAELSGNAFNSLLRKIPLERGDAIFMISRRCNISYGAVKSFEKGIPRIHAATLLDIAKEYDIKMYIHQFRPTRQIIENWLMFCLEVDKPLGSSKWIFKHWDKATLGRAA